MYERVQFVFPCLESLRFIVRWAMIIFVLFVACFFVYIKRVLLRDGLFEFLHYYRSRILHFVKLGVREYYLRTTFIIESNFLSYYEQLNN